MDFDAARAKIATLSAEKAAYESELLSIERNTAAEGKRMEIREVQLELSTLESENKAYRTQQTAGVPDTAAMRRNLARLQAQHAAKLRTIDTEKSYVAQLDNDIASARERWISVNGETFTGGSCPTCGQALPAVQLKAAADGFEAQKAKRLREIEQTANANKEARAAAWARIASAESEIAELESEVTKEAGVLTDAESHVVAVTDMPGYSEKREVIQRRIDALNGELADIMTDSTSARSKLLGQISEIKQEIESWSVYLGKESLLEYSRKRVEELQEDARNAAEKLDAIEEMLQHDGSYLLEAVVAKEEMVFPMTPTGKSVNYVMLNRDEIYKL
jgi:chromosome segregation ATPase